MAKTEHGAPRAQARGWEELELERGQRGLGCGCATRQGRAICGEPSLGLSNSRWCFGIFAILKKLGITTLFGVVCEKHYRIVGPNLAKTLPIQNCCLVCFVTGNKDYWLLILRWSSVLYSRGLQLESQLGRAREAADQCFSHVVVSLSLSPSPSLKSVNYSHVRVKKYINVFI